MTGNRARLPWTGWASLLVSILVIAFPYLFPSIFPEGSVTYYVITIPLRMVVGIFAYVARNWWLMALAVVAGLSPLLFIWLILTLMKIIYAVTGGRYPWPEWL
ncbi:hypothetical protein [Corynebacterium halotolerans]|uniref:Uncharacterized protein n=1 Tax=Corynebacterium halotolerans YIM 70093 = DSM 44683 TaxID=1121362 RepID=M1P6X9_9CORY|nr:hypothetical protein [Corynebacterium halotolerans]AGF72401.1 hypothetical protein A605_06995 [Corynebacterium halotolerans YIM 70093 = DSM 44683]